MAACAKIPVGIVEETGNLNLIHKDSPGPAFLCGRLEEFLDDAASVEMLGPGFQILLKDVDKEGDILLPKRLGLSSKLHACCSILLRRTGSPWDRNFGTTRYP